MRKDSALFIMTESNRIEFKRELTKELDIEREVVAFLNYREGGIIYIGIDDSGQAVGVQDIDGDMLRIKDRIRNGISPSPMGLFDVTIEQINHIPVIKIFIASGTEKPYYKTKFGLSERGCFLRVGTAAEPMTPEQIANLYQQRIHNSIHNIPSPRQDLTFNQLRIYYEEKGMHLNDQYLRTLELLTDDGILNYVAYLLADENGNSMKLARYAGTDRYELISNNEYGYTCLLTATQKVLDKLDVENKVHSVITPTGRHDTHQWDKLAVREAVINAIVHNNYNYGAPAKIELFSDHLEITSVGHLPEGMSQEDFFSGMSMPRNKELMRIFRDMEMVEALGSGMMRILRTYGRENFQFGDNFIRLSIPYADIVSDRMDDRIKNNEQLTERQLIIYNILQENALHSDRINDRITTQYLIDKLNLSDRTIRRELTILKEKGLITRVGSRKIGYWELAK